MAIKQEENFHCFSQLTVLFTLAKMAMTIGQLIAHKNNYYSAIHKQKILCLITQCICFLLSPLFRIFI